MGCNFFVHQRLGQCWCVLLVVAEFAEANDVQHHIFFERHAVVQSHLCGKYYGLRIVAIDVQYRRFHHLHNVCTEHAGSHVTWVRGGETDLVVDDDVYRTTRGVTTRLCQSKGFLVDALAAKCRVSVHQHRQHLRALWISTAVHARTHRAFHHRVHDFKMRWVECQRQMHRTTGGADV